MGSCLLVHGKDRNVRWTKRFRRVILPLLPELFLTREGSQKLLNHAEKVIPGKPRVQKYHAIAGMSPPQRTDQVRALAHQNKGWC